MTPLLEARSLVRTYHIPTGAFGRPTPVRAVDGISLSVNVGETLGIVGESGSGKSTLGRMLLGIDPVQSGEVLFEGKPMPAVATRLWRAWRAKMQFVHQDPLAALDKRLTISAQIREPLDIHKLVPKEQRNLRVTELMSAVGLRQDQADRYPHELSGGQRQRAVIARALASRPKLIVCDEPVSALDVSIQAQVVNMLSDLQAENRLAMVFISHDLKVVRNIADRVAVMYLGRIVEEASSDVIFSSPQHPYTKALVSSVPVPGRQLEGRVILQGEPPNPANRPSGCAFHPRCPIAAEICRTTVPALQTIGDGRTAACHLVKTDDASIAA
ncbi:MULTISPECIES: ABC transporter ATP-binding protein [unclassified Rhizobium]|uniref:ABC transporter ATP-binding protein n=1 Tax=unclassified Rhizobium TaxID=2613769 RepID=UPI001AD99B1D|nr:MULTISPECIES: ABC transporter ATP-binding protein [unclassified Rhizobium]MBO9100652.1 ABC transporter ATP-binding protein [Rhizobium sp. L58/93]MBO9171298.1 ABC transporter ATP-binding protein [Rhizobium sp. L245/93]MBO9187165.1 ABC transporter ATP-binding protein [Rhizobium sp. E27B/91]MBO9135986.1 ABC transporter ATP-binding protein [Rhizobium sp. B209b/85]QXZ87854.1 ABC transporter ATP-binding protein [Rhizobium sp. K1/93]